MRSHIQEIGHQHLNRVVHFLFFLLIKTNKLKDPHFSSKHIPLAFGLADRSFKLQTHELVHLGTKFVRELIEDVPAKPRDHSSHCFLIVDTSLLEVEQLIFTNFGGRGFVFNASCGVFRLLTEPKGINKQLLHNKKGNLLPIYHQLLHLHAILNRSTNISFSSVLAYKLTDIITQGTTQRSDIR